MSYLERFIIGVIIIISAFALYNNAEERHEFHQAVALLSKTVGKCLGCFKCIQTYRQIVVLFVFTAGTSLVLDSGATLAIFAQIILIALDYSSLGCACDIISMKPILTNLAILFFLIKNWKESKAQAEEAKANQGSSAIIQNLPEPPKPKIPSPDDIKLRQIETALRNSNNKPKKK